MLGVDVQNARAFDSAIRFVDESQVSLVKSFAPAPVADTLYFFRCHEIGPAD